MTNPQTSDAPPRPARESAAHAPRTLAAVPPRRERNHKSPVAWLFGQQFLGALKGALLYAAYGAKLDARSWMQAEVFPSADRAEALQFWLDNTRREDERATHDAGAQQNGHDGQSAERLARLERLWEERGEFWFDYISDTGDGTRATYGVAYLCLSDIYLPTLDAQKLKRGERVYQSGGEPAPEGYVPLPRGQFLFVGGDTAYHASDYMTLAERVQNPFTWAYEDHHFARGEPRRPLIGIPANHDYYDQLDGYRRQFLRPVKEEPMFDACPEKPEFGGPQLCVPGFYRVQRASYVALNLPFDWQLWGLDTDVGQVDERQRKFFRGLCRRDERFADADCVVPPKKLVVASCAPTTVYGEVAKANDEKGADAYAQVGLPQAFLPEKDASGKFDFLKTSGDAKLEDGQCRLDLSGDIHQYARYWGPRSGESPRANARAEAPSAESYASVVSGIGGAFHHPTTTYMDEIQEQVVYPSEKASRDETARRIFNFKNIWAGGYVFLMGFVLAFVVYFASSVPQSSRQVINNSWPVTALGLDYRPSEPVQPTTYPVAEVGKGEAVKPFALWRSLGLARDTWLPPGPCAQNSPRYFYGPCRADWPTDFTLGFFLIFASFVPIVYAFARSKSLFGAEIKEARVTEKCGRKAIKVDRIESEVNARPEKRLWLIVVLAALFAFVGLATLKPYRAHITPFGSSLVVLFSLVWAAAATALGVRYKEFLHMKAHRTAVRKRDWALPWVLTVLSVVGIAFALWSFGRNNLPALLVSDIVFALVLLAGTAAIFGLPWGMAHVLLKPKGKYLMPEALGKFLIGLWHFLLQILVPFMLIRRGTPLTWIVAAVLVLLPIRLRPYTPLAAWVGEKIMQANRRGGVALAWLVYGGLMLALTYLTSPPFLSEGLPSWLLNQPFMSADWSGWWGLLASLIAGAAGAVLCCLWFGWYLAVCLAYDGHNNEVGGAARIEGFKEMVRVRLRPEGLTAYVIAFDQTSDDGARLDARLVDVFDLKPKGA